MNSQAGFGPETFQFLEDLKANNNKVCCWRKCSAVQGQLARRKLVEPEAKNQGIMSAHPIKNTKEKESSGLNGLAEFKQQTEMQVFRTAQGACVLDAGPWCLCGPLSMK